MNEADKYSPEGTVRLLIGNKTDLKEKRAVTYEEGKQLAAQFGISYLEASAKDSRNVAEAFKALAKEIKGKIMPQKTKQIAPTTTSISYELRRN